MTRNLAANAFDTKEICDGGELCKSSKCTWEKSGGDRHYACDLCIKKRRPCVRLVKPVPEQNLYAADWYPVPHAERPHYEVGDISCRTRLECV